MLTSRPVGNDERVPLAGVPYHSVEPHIAKLVNAGYKVAIAEQDGNKPPPGEKLVDSAVRRVITAGTVVEPAMLDEGRNNYLAAVAHRTSPTPRIRAMSASPTPTSPPASSPRPRSADRKRCRVLQEELARLQPAEVLRQRRR